VKRRRREEENEGQGKSSYYLGKGVGENGKPQDYPIRETLCKKLKNFLFWGGEKKKQKRENEQALEEPTIRELEGRGRTVGERGGEGGFCTLLHGITEGGGGLGWAGPTASRR